ncbi:hypothetical protein [Bifidobacterium thermacidophilum]|uniref:hypothetical protein n=1 Tax=Bifidobacterium thermacidophilum TaxID=246618 RepID=UPI00193099A7|nr:hypothetical protein [Bifidobacterium thermacidophilum]
MEESQRILALLFQQTLMAERVDAQRVPGVDGGDGTVAAGGQGAPTARYPDGLTGG